MLTHKDKLVGVANGALAFNINCCWVCSTKPGYTNQTLGGDSINTGNNLTIIRSSCPCT